MSTICRKRLGDIINLKRGYDLPSQSRLDGPYPVISSSGISGYHSEFKVDGEGLITGRYGTLGEVYYISGKYWPHNTTLYVTDFKSNCPKYVYYLLKCLGNLKTSDKSAVPGVNRNDLHEIVVPYIQSEQQESVAKVLSDLDSKIELSNKINAELEAMAKLIYDYWFVQFDFPNAKGKPYKASGGKMVWSEELKREIPEGWSAGVASDIFKFNPTLSVKKGSLSSYIDMNALPEFGFMTKEIQKKEFNGGMKFQNGDLAVARITPCLENGKTGLITLLEEDEIGFGSTEFIILRGKEFDLRSFASCLSRSENFRKFAISKMTGTSGRKRVSSTDLELFEMPIPTNEILKRFELLASPFFKTTTSNVRENQELSEIRDWLLPMLMNGQVKVGDAERELVMGAEQEPRYTKKKVKSK
ncbi:MAG: restriction endonuclease subunit S [Chryseolinea sp.]